MDRLCEHIMFKRFGQCYELHKTFPLICFGENENVKLSKVKVYQCQEIVQKV